MKMTASYLIIKIKVIARLSPLQSILNFQPNEKEKKKQQAIRMTHQEVILEITEIQAVIQKIILAQEIL